MLKPLSRYVLAPLFLVSTCLPAAQAAPRIMERLDRGVVATRANTTDAFISWRLLGLDPESIAFNIYRTSGKEAPVKLNIDPLTGGTNYKDNTLSFTVDNTYIIRSVVNGVEQPAEGQFTLKAGIAAEPVIRIPLSAPPGENYYTRYVWVGDVDGDGQYEFVLDRISPGDPNKTLTTLGNNFVDAYKMDGTHLWRIDMGVNSRYAYSHNPGSAALSVGMADGLTVYDLNGDGKAEVVLKIANGTKFADGTTFTADNDEAQSLAVIDGISGSPLATISFPNDISEWGRLSTQLGIGYVNGVNPSVILWGRNRGADLNFHDVIASFSWNGGKEISTNWTWVRPPGGFDASHQLRIIDVDGDGKDEVMTGNFVVNSDGTTRYKLDGVVHGDRFYVGKLNPYRAGMQGYGIQQNNASGLLEYGYDASTGEILWTHRRAGGTEDVGRGLVGDIDPQSPGYESWAFYGVKNSSTGEVLYAADVSPYPTHSIWWDGDELTEGLNANRIEKWNYLNPRPASRVPRFLLLSDYGAKLYGNLNPNFFGDILGDWRTEIVVTNADSSELLIFTTNILTDNRHYTMAHNPAYRNHMTLKGYLQSPLLDYYFGAGMEPAPKPAIVYAGEQ